MLKKRGENPDAWVVDVHTKVINELSVKFVNTGILSNESLQRLKRLKTKRVKADYYLEREFQLEEMNRIFELYRDFIHELIAVVPTISRLKSPLPPLGKGEIERW